MTLLAVAGRDIRRVPDTGFKESIANLPARMASRLATPAATSGGHFPSPPIGRRTASCFHWRAHQRRQ
jgi:hypothetical protein